MESQNRTYAFIISAALFFTPYTALRLSNIGIPELLITVLFFKLLIEDRLDFNISGNNRFIFTKFWIVFLIISSLGILANYIILNHVSGTLKGLVFDSSAYILIFICCFCLEVIFNNKLIEFRTKKLIKNVYFSISLSLIILFLLSRVTNSILGFSLLYNVYFSPFAANVHHTAMVVAPLPFLGFLVFSEEKRIFKKIFILILVIFNVIVVLNTGSTKAIMGLVIGAMVFMFFVLLKRIKGSNKKFMFITFFLLVSSTVAIIYWDVIYLSLSNYFVENDLSGARASLYNESLVKGFGSILVGYGPGAHVQVFQGYYSDAHSTIATAFLQAGLLGLVVFIIFLLRVISKCINQPYIIAALTPILVYAVGGDILRRLPMWMFMVLFYYYCQKVKNEYRGIK
jgi:O-antigen ligase